MFVSTTRYRSLPRVLLPIVCCAAAWLSGCGSGSINNPFTPTRIVVFGDGLSDLTTGARYTVNDATLTAPINNWTLEVASRYGVASTSFSANAKGNALVSDIATQVSSFGAHYGSGDLVLIDAGFRDMINLAQGTASTATATTLGDSYANVIRSIVSNGAQHVAPVTLNDFSTSYGANGGLPSAATMHTLIRAFNDALKANLGDSTKPYIGNNVRLVDFELQFNYVVGAPVTYGFIDSSTVACTSTGGASIGFGTITSNNCSKATVGGLTYNSYVYADPVYPTPAVHVNLGDYAATGLLARW